MKAVFASLGAYGHLYPMMPLALACVAAGHDVVVATGEPFLGRLPLPTVPGVPADATLDGVVQETIRRHPGIEGRDLGVALFADTTAEMVVPEMLETLDRLRPDLVVYEPLNVGAGIASDLLGIPAVAFAIGLSHEAVRTIHAAAIDYHRALWTERGRTPPDGRVVLGAALLDPIPLTLQSVDPHATERRIPIRPVGYSEDLAALPSWLTTLRVRPRVYLTLGTVSFGAVEVLTRAIAEIADLDVDVLVAIGPEGDAGLLEPLPTNVHVERFVNQSKVLSTVDVVVHHGGTGTVLGALAAGLPQLILPQGADQFHNARVLADIGAGRALLNNEQTPGAIRAAVAELLTGGPVSAVSIRLGEEIAAMPAPADVVRVLVKLTVGRGSAAK